MLGRLLRFAIPVIYLVVGFIVANSHSYFAHVNGAKPIVSAVAAVLLWPLVLFGVDLRF